MKITVIMEATEGVKVFVLKNFKIRPGPEWEYPNRFFIFHVL